MRATTEETLAWMAEFVKAPSIYCAKCGVMNELEPPAWWRGNCYHFRAQALKDTDNAN